MRPPSARFLFPLLLLVAVVLVVVSRSPLQIRDERLGIPRPVRYQPFRAEIMATTIQALLPEGPEAPALAESVFAVFREVDARMSEWKPTSPLSAVNADAGGEPVPVPADLREVLRKGMEVGAFTGGAFDITWAALWGLWDFQAAEPRVPDSALVARGVARVDYRKVRIDDAAGTVFLPEAGMKLGLGGIAKGYALDRAAAVLGRRGVSSFLLMAGGQVYAGGTKNGMPWRVGIRDPRGAPDDYFAMLAVTDASVSTSGDYESFFLAEGVRYHHILDPRTGMPSRTLRSATVISHDATLADALSTAIMVMGGERGIALADSLSGVEAVVVDEAGSFRVTPGLEGRLEILHAPRS